MSNVPVHIPDWIIPAALAHGLIWSIGHTGEYGLTEKGEQVLRDYLSRHKPAGDS